MKRRLFTLLCALSLLLCVAVTTAWLMSHRVHHRVVLSYRREIPPVYAHGWEIESNSGRVVVRLDRYWREGQDQSPFRTGGEPGIEVIEYEPIPFVWRAPGSWWNAMGFGFKRAPRAVANSNIWHDGFILLLPHWLAAALFLIPPLLWVVRQVSHRRHRARHACPSCGYDLRATPTRCPECGEPAAPAGVQPSP